MNGYMRPWRGEQARHCGPRQPAALLREYAAVLEAREFTLRAPR